MAKTDNTTIRAWVQVGLTVAFTPTCLWIVIATQGEGSLSKWAIGMLGLIVGYWLK